MHYTDQCPYCGPSHIRICFPCCCSFMWNNSNCSAFLAKLSDSQNWKLRRWLGISLSPAPELSRSSCASFEIEHAALLWWSAVDAQSSKAFFMGMAHLKHERTLLMWAELWTCRGQITDIMPRVWPEKSKWAAILSYNLKQRSLETKYKGLKVVPIKLVLHLLYLWSRDFDRWSVVATKRNSPVYLSLKFKLLENRFAIDMRNLWDQSERSCQRRRQSFVQNI